MLWYVLHWIDRSFSASGKTSHRGLLSSLTITGVRFIQYSPSYSALFISLKYLYILTDKLLMGSIMSLPNPQYIQNYINYTKLQQLQQLHQLHKWANWMSLYSWRLSWIHYTFILCGDSDYSYTQTGNKHQNVQNLVFSIRIQIYC